MPDITICINDKCEKKEECYRYKAKPNEYRQFYDVFDPKKIDCFKEMRRNDKNI